tara:strand:+ start:410 stop:670 length:261 start_codon:yes stop_codon:yes gene_type:complete
MTTIAFVLAIMATIISVFTLLMAISQYRSLEIYMYDLEQGLRECASRTSENKLDISTIDNRTKAKPKAKRGRPRKNTPKLHKNGEQ